MTYDFHGSWDQNRAHHSSLNSKDNGNDDTMYIVCHIFIYHFEVFFSKKNYFCRIMLLNIIKN